jgi:glycosyltransferase involved in cell wall biosynthesis
MTAPLKVAILSDSGDSFPKPMGRGLHRMVQAAGAEPLLLEQGLAGLPRKLNLLGRGLSGQARLRAILQAWARRWRSRRLLRQLQPADLVVLIGHLPAAYYGHWFCDRTLRKALGRRPLALYDLIYLGNDPYWTQRLARVVAEPTIRPGQHWGLNRFDHHLCVSEVGGESLLPGAERFSRIGIDLNEPSLQPQENATFTALIDFERPDQIAPRALQVTACLEAGIPFRVLHGRYRMEDIRAEYRACGVYFLAHYESFGLPILEAQACGARVLTPDAEWCRAHHLTSEGRKRERLPDNVIAYGQDKDRLVRTLRELRANHDPVRNRQRFIAQQPAFFHGDVARLREFLQQVAAGTIHSRSHRDYPDLDTMAATTL